ncbi:hypothetical protein CVT25_010663 [Psilocybe cyanescens]|uniref:Uncharacterized protein n=1 Tax=Psilocybe cyanescens TaxID=93625 RepID=A0A409WJZ5_PSICY|nr:hypothetical protein CVT25_010663 [Psilocybe cyanescens]
MHWIKERQQGKLTGVANPYNRVVLDMSREIVVKESHPDGTWNDFCDMVVSGILVKEEEIDRQAYKD